MVGEVVGLGQAQAQGGGALLSAGGEVGGRPAVEIDEQVVSVGSDGGGAAGQVAGFRLAQGLRVSGLVGEAQRLGRIVGRAQSEVSGGGEVGEGAGGLGAGLPDWLGGGLEQLVPLLQLGVEGAALGDAFEQGVALRQCALVAAEIGRVGALPLSDGDIEIASAEGRGTGEQVEIEGGELDGADRAEGLGGSAGDAVDANPLAGQGSAGSLSGGAGGAGGASGAGGERDFDPERLGVDEGLAGDAHDLGLVGVPADQFAFGLGAGGAQGGEHVDRLDEVGFAGGVGSADQGESGSEVECELSPGAEVGELESGEVHSFECMRGGLERHDDATAATADR